MRITKNQLRQIIKEELSAVIREAASEKDTPEQLKDHPGKSCDEAHPDMSHEDFMKEEGPSGKAASSRKDRMRSRGSQSSGSIRGVTRESLKKKRAMKAKRAKTK
jgi:hypothetical protein